MHTEKILSAGNAITSTGRLRMPVSIRKAVALATTLFFLCAALPPPPAHALTVREESELADEFLKAVHEYYDVIEDPMINNYINELGRKLTVGVPPQPFEFHFYVIREDTFNAFAGPGGNIFVFSGLIDALENENELAGILTHEIAHVTARHISDMIEKSKKTSLATVAGMVTGILVGLGGASAVGSALTFGSVAAGQSMVLAYTRENEMQADTLGRKYLTAAGYNLNGLLTALERIRSQEWFGEESIPTYLKTHPATADRINSLSNTLSNQKPPPPKNTYAFDQTRARIIALYGNPNSRLERLAKMAQAQPNNPAIQYGYGLALAESGQPENAVSRLNNAIALKPDDQYMTIALGKAQFMAGNYPLALKTLTGIQNLHRYGPEGLFYLGRVQMATGNPAAAVDTFEKLLADSPDHTETMMFLGECYGEQGKLGQAHYYLGKYYRKKGNLKNARFHFEHSLKNTDDPAKRRELEEMIGTLKDYRKRTDEWEPDAPPPGFTPGRNGKISLKMYPFPGTMNEGPSYSRTFSTGEPMH